MSRPATAAAILAIAAGLGAKAATAETPTPPPARDFVQAAASSDAFEIAEAEDAAAQSRNPQVLAFAHTMIGDHAADLQAVDQAARKAGLPPPARSLSGDQAAMLGAAQSLRGEAFDKAYARQQALAHTQALIVTRAYAGAGSDPDIREAARSALPMIQHHLEAAQRLGASLGEP